MKKVLVFVAALLCFSACSNNNNNNDVDGEVDGEVENFLFELGYTNDQAFAIEEYCYLRKDSVGGQFDYDYKICSFVFENNLESLLGIKNSKTKIFTSREEYLESKNKIKNVTKFRNSNSNDLFPDIDFAKFNVGVTASYDQIDDFLNGDYIFEASSIVKKGQNSVHQIISVKNTRDDYSDSNQYSCCLLFTIFDKDENLTFKTDYLDLVDPHSVIMKPIIYFYPEQEMDLTIKVTNDYNLITTYPKYNNGWNIHLNEDGTFTTNISDREYYALYFDEKPNYVCPFDEGFYVTKENAISFLEEKMDYMGFTNRETNEFIMYWLPILEDNEKSLVYFEQTEQRNAECPLEFSTNPDTLIRTIIHIKKVDEETQINEQTLTHYDRNGFVVTEWGGINY